VVFLYEESFKNFCPTVPGACKAETTPKQTNGKIGTTNKK
jgi:hypothetical protein